MKVKNVVIINDYDYVQGGASKVAIQTANILKENNPRLNVYFFSGDHNDSSTIRADIICICTNQGEALRDKNKFRGIVNGIYNFKAKKKLKELLNKLEKEETIIHVHGWTKCLSSSIFDIAFNMKFKTVLTLHDYFTACPNGGYFNYKKNEICHFKPLSSKCIGCNCDSRNYLFKIYRVIRLFMQNKVVKLSDRLTDAIVISKFSEEIIKKTINNDTKIHSVNNPIDLDQNPKIIDYKNNKYYLYVGRVSKEKGVDIFCNAVTKAKKKGIVVGDGPELNKLRVMFPNVRFIGWKNNDEVKRIMRGAKALVIPSRWYEGAPLTPLEALQYGIPIITSDCNASVDYINSYNGKIFNIKKDDLSEILLNFSCKYRPSLNINYNYYDRIINVYNNVSNRY